jgi:hypothetical protein
MNSQRHRESVLITGFRWLARIASVVSIALLLLFFNGFHPSQVRPSEWIGLAFFPFGVVLGMLISWKREFEGSLVSLGSLAAFYLVYGLMLTGRLPGGVAFVAFTIPAFLFLAAWLMQKMTGPQRADLISR